MFNEASGIEEFCSRLRPILDGLSMSYEAVFVDDGSEDDSVQAVLRTAWPESRVVSLARNVGHQRAIEAGLSVARGEWIVTMDADGQHPPALIPEMVHLAINGDLDVVYTARSKRGDDQLAKRTSALAYYRISRWLTGVPIGDSQADFRLVSRRVIDHLADVRGEKVLRLLLPSLGPRSAVLDYEALPRISGRSRFGLGHQVSMAVDSALTFSSKPLRLVAAMAWVLALASFVWLLVVVATYLTEGAVAGWSSVMTAVLFVGGMSLLGLSIIGSYVARIHDMVKQQPRYFVDRISAPTSSEDE
jgi:dolichol-phosphate mannosyltransferase